MSSSIENYCTFTLAPDATAGGLPSQEEICKDLESNDPKVKRLALKAAIMAMLSGESMPKVLMQVIRFCINTDDHQLKKLMMLYWEVVPKYQTDLHASATGESTSRKLLPEMILVCNALRNDLIHPNEYVRGSMLRFLCKVKDQEILGPLLPSIKQCLEHRHPYVRKNATLCIYHIHKLHGEDLLPDASEIIQAFLLSETDAAARRNAFLMLVNQAEDLALEYLAQNADTALTFGDGFCLLVLELTRRVCRRDPLQKARFVQILFSMLTSSSHAVCYESAWTLLSLTQSPTAIRASVNVFTSLLTNSQCDTNVKLIVLHRLMELKTEGGGRYTKVLQESVMDILRCLSACSDNMDVCRKVLEVAMDCVGTRVVEDVVTVLKREVSKTLGNSQPNAQAQQGSYQVLLVQHLHSLCRKFPVVAPGCIGVLLDLLSASDVQTALQVVLFVRSMVGEQPTLRTELVERLTMKLDEVTDASVMAVCVWVLGEYSSGDSDNVFEALCDAIGPSPFVAKEEPKSENATKEAAKPVVTTSNVILSDGTYATQTSISTPAVPVEKAENIHPLRRMIIRGNSYLGGVLCTALTKLVLRLTATSTVRQANLAKVKVLQVITGIARSSKAHSSLPQNSSYVDVVDRLTILARVLLDPKVRAVWEETQAMARDSLNKFLGGTSNQSEKKPLQQIILSPVDEIIFFRQLSDSSVGPMLSASSTVTTLTKSTDKHQHVHQLTGLSDPVYCEALVTVNDYDIVLDLLLINRTADVLKDLTVEIACVGDMKIVERPQVHTLGPLDQCTLRSSIKVSSTETGHIFGTVCFNGDNILHLNDIHLDIMDYIRPAYTTDTNFRAMWAEFEWENKVAVATTCTEVEGQNPLNNFLNHIVNSTNMRNLTTTAYDQNSSFLAANLYAKSVFGEDALVNVSIEKKKVEAGPSSVGTTGGDCKLTGYIRIRSKTQGIALSLGDRMTSVQRTLPSADSE